MERRPALRARVVHRRPSRPRVARGRERRGQDDPAPGDRRGDVAAGRKARLRQGHEDRPPRPASSAGVRRHAARVRAVGCPRPDRGRGRAAAARGGDGRGSARHGHAQALRRRTGPARARGRMGVARASHVHHPRARLRGSRPRPPARHLLGRRADEGVTGACARGQPRPAPARRADQPPRRPEPRVARARARDDRCRRDPGRARPLVPGGGHDLRARALTGRRALLRRPVARVASGEGRSRGRRREDRRSRLGRHRPARALRRTLPLQEVEGEAGTGEADADRPIWRRSAPRPAASSSR